MTNFLEGCKKVGNLYRLFENTYLDRNSMEKIEISDKLTESINGQEVPVYGAYLTKIWNEKEHNLNHRNYRRVIDQVIQENKVTYGLVNHPKEGEEDPARIYAIQKNPHRKDGWLVVETYFVGDYGKLAENALRLGGPLCVSSSALGDVDLDTGDVLPGKDFILERYGDWVFGPSNGAYQFLKDVAPSEVSMEERKPVVKELITEKTEKKEIVDENLTIYSKDNNKGETLMADKLIETNLTFNIRGLLKECDTLPTLAEQKALLETALEAAEQLTDKTLFEDIKKRLADNISKTTEYAEKGKTVDSLTESIKTLNEEKQKLVEDIEKIKKEKEDLVAEHTTLVKMYEEKQFDASDTEKAVVTKLNESVKQMKARNGFLKKKIAYLTEKRDYFEALSNTKIDADYLVTAKLETEKLEEKYHKLQESVASRKPKAVEKKIVEKAVAPESKSSFAVKEVEDYFNRIMAKDASVKQFEPKFQKCKTLQEAQILRMHTKDGTEPKVLEEKAEKPEVKVPEKAKKTSLEITLEQNGLF